MLLVRKNRVAYFKGLSAKKELYMGNTNGENVEVVEVVNRKKYGDHRREKYGCYEELWEPTSDELILLEEIFKDQSSRPPF